MGARPDHRAEPRRTRRRHEFRRKAASSCGTALKTDGLKAIIQAHGFTGVIAGIRRDEEGTRAKERVSDRAARVGMEFPRPATGILEHFQTDLPAGSHLRVHPLLHWTELDVWSYIRREGIPVVDLYFARNGLRYRSLGCAPCTLPVPSEAVTVDDIIAELKGTKTAERAGRAQDRDPRMRSALRADGYM